MEFERDVLVSPTTEVPVIEGQVVTAIRTLASRGVGKKAIAREIGVAVNTVRRYLREPITPGQQVRPAARRLTDERRAEARTLYEGVAAGNAVVVQRLLAEGGCAMSVRTIERSVADIRRAQRVAGSNPSGSSCMSAACTHDDAGGVFGSVLRAGALLARALLRFLAPFLARAFTSLTRLRCPAALR